MVANGKRRVGQAGPRAAPRTSGGTFAYVGGIVAAFLYLLALFTPLLLGYARYPVYIVWCGHRPVVTSSGLFGDRSYTVPGDDDYGPDIFTRELFCTAQEAEDAGYQRSTTSITP